MTALIGGTVLAGLILFFTYLADKKVRESESPSEDLMTEQIQVGLGAVVMTVGSLILGLPAVLPTAAATYWWWIKWQEKKEFLENNSGKIGDDPSYPDLFSSVKKEVD